jgi:RND superfamily putative drug exporter
VIGLSVLLLMIVFRSIAVPIKATLGYLLSVGAALGAVVASFQWGWLGSVVGESSGPIVSFLPIFVMGVLFGLAMDYEMFLVSAMREDYVAHGDPEGAVLRGFKASSIVVTAAAAIMVSVFIAFIPGGSSTIKPIAFGLAIGVAVDAFVVRMTLVPAVLVMLGHRAWWLPAWLDRVLPEVDVEGEALHRKVAYEEWAATTGPTVLYTRDLVVRAGTPPLDVVAPPGAVTRVVVPDGLDERHLAHLLTGRAAAPAGEVVVDGMLLPEQRGQVHRVATVVDVAAVMSDEQLEAQLRADVRVHRSTRRGRRRAVDRVVARTADLEQSVGPASPHSMRPALVQAAEALEQQAALVVLVGLDGLLLAPDRHRATRLAHALAAPGIGVVVLEAPARGRGPVPEQAQQHPVEQAGDLTVEETRGSHD